MNNDPIKLKMTVADALEFADEWSKGLTLYEGAQGWRVVCMLLAEEVRRISSASLPPEDHWCAAGVEPCPCAVTALKDAARYRWLRDGGGSRDYAICQYLPDEDSDWFALGIKPSHIDATLDAAMARDKS